MSDSAQSLAKSAAQKIEHRILPFLLLSEAVIYTLIGLAFLVSAVGMLVYTVASFLDTFQRQGFLLSIVVAINDLLLVMIMMEVLRTIVSYLGEEKTSLRPFLFIAAISATRRVLAVGAQMTIAGEDLPVAKFEQAMTELVVNAGAILVIALALFLLDRYGPGRPIRMKHRAPATKKGISVARRARTIRRVSPRQST